MKPALKDNTFQKALRQIHKILKTLCILSVKAKNEDDAIRALLVINNDLLRINEILDCYKFNQPSISITRWPKEELEEGGSVVKVDNSRDWAHLKFESSLSASSASDSLPESHPLPLPWKEAVVEDQVLSLIKREAGEEIDPAGLVDSASDDADLPPSPESEEDVPSLKETAVASPKEEVGFADYSILEEEETVIPEGGYFRSGWCQLCKTNVYNVKRMDPEDRNEEEKKHMIRYHPKRVMKCNCGVIVLDKSHIEDHKKIHPDGEMSLSPLIKVEFKFKRALRDFVKKCQMN